MPSYRNNRGFTLAELVIVMAVTGIMTALVISFTVTMNGWSQVGIHRYELVQSERMAENALRMFISAYDADAYYFTVEDDGQLLVAREVAAPDRQKTFRLDQNVLRYQMLNDNEGEIALDHITGLDMSIHTNGSHRQMIIMRLSFALPETYANVRDMSGEYTVLVCTRATGGAA